MLRFELVCTPTAVQFKRKLDLIDFNPYVLYKYWFQIVIVFLCYIV